MMKVCGPSLFAGVLSCRRYRQDGVRVAVGGLDGGGCGAEERPGDLMFWDSYLGRDRIATSCSSPIPPPTPPSKARDRERGTGTFSYRTGPSTTDSRSIGHPLRRRHPHNDIDSLLPDDHGEVDSMLIRPAPRRCRVATSLARR